MLRLAQAAKSMEEVVLKWIGGGNTVFVVRSCARMRAAQPTAATDRRSGASEQVGKRATTADAFVEPPAELARLLSPHTSRLHQIEEGKLVAALVAHQVAGCLAMAGVAEVVTELVTEQDGQERH